MGRESEWVAAGRPGRLVPCMVLIGLGLVAGTAQADDADVLPQGVWQAGVMTDYYMPIDERYGPDGQVEDAAVDYNTTLDNGVFAALPAGAVLGDTMVDFKYRFRIVELTFTRGVTPRFTLGVRIPYWWVKNDVRTALDQSTANFGKIPVAPFLAPVSLGGVPLTEDEVQDLIGPGLDANGDGTVDIPGFGFDRVATWSESGLSDIELGGRYQYHRGDAWHLAFTGGLRLPTGRVDDPDSLVDYGFGSGAYALLFHFNNDFVAMAPLVVNVTLIYEMVLPDHELLRVPADVNAPVTTNKERVKRDIGDARGVDVTAKYGLTRAVSAYARYKYMAKAKNDVSGNKGFSYESLEEETDAMEQIYYVGFGYSTLARFAETRAGVPMTVAIEYRNRFDGTNNVFKSDYIGVNLSVFF